MKYVISIWVNTLVLLCVAIFSFVVVVYNSNGSEEQSNNTNTCFLGTKRLLLCGAALRNSTFTKILHT